MALFEAWRGTTGTESSEQCDIGKLKLDDKIDGIVFDAKQNSLKGGQLSKLVELITSHNNYESELASILLMCHHSFTTSVELLKCLTARYEGIIPPSNLNEREFTAWFEIKVKPIQQNVLKVLATWISLYFEEDFVQNEILFSNTRDYIDKVILADWEVNGKLLLGTMDLKMAAIGTNQTHQAKQALLKVVPKAFGLFSGIDPAVLFSDATRIVELDPLEFAKQLTISEFDDFLLVRASECLDQIWASKIEKERVAARLQAMGRKTAGKACTKEYTSSPQSAISRMISHTNNLTIWIATVIISASNVKIRVILLKYFAQCAIKCRDIKNYNGITGIVAGLSMAPVARLHRTWRKFNKHYPSICAEYEQTAEIVSPKGQYASYRKEMKDIKLPAIPFLGLFFTDLTFIDLGNPELLPNTDINASRKVRLINFDKCKKIHGVIKEIQKFQATPFQWQAIEGVQNFLSRIGETKAKFSTEPIGVSEDLSLSGLGVATEEELYTQSLVIEPKEEEQDEDSDDENQQ
ncbi:ras guanine nucleotide exchange factor domain-containing protein [Obelidium mucronatum]|nr:ras guanine nucleotide exchange factor domain-containing protein [Obelidium mucronatum]